MASRSYGFLLSIFFVVLILTTGNWKKQIPIYYLAYNYGGNRFFSYYFFLNEGKPHKSVDRYNFMVKFIIR